MSGFPPTPQDKFSFGSWTFGGTAGDNFGDATRAPLDLAMEHPPDVR